MIEKSGLMDNTKRSGANLAIHVDGDLLERYLPGVEGVTTRGLLHLLYGRLLQGIRTAVVDWVHNTAQLRAFTGDKRAYRATLLINTAANGWINIV